jgi:hypothetical protein
MGEHNGFTQSGLSFARAADLLVGQDVQIRAQTVRPRAASPRSRRIDPTSNRREIIPEADTMT